MTISPPATKRDVEEIVGRVVGEIVGAAMQVISDHMDKKFKGIDHRFDRLEARVDKMEQRLERVEDKLDASIARVDHHDIDIRELRRKTA